MKKRVNVLKRVLMRMRDEDQDGFVGVGPDGRYAGHARWVSSSLPMVTPEELDELMELAGIEPDPVVVNGSCKDCLHASLKGSSRGWGRPCSGCKSPVMSEFTPLNGRERKDRPTGGDGCGCNTCFVRPEVLRRLKTTT